MKAIRSLIVRMARENSTWGYCRIQGELRAVGHKVARSTIANVLKDNGVRPAPERTSSWRPSSWRAFLKAHWGADAGMDFFTTEVWTPKGRRTYYVLFAIQLKSRRVHIAGITPHPGGAFMAQVARNLTDAIDGFLLGQRFVICVRDLCFTRQFRGVLRAAGTRVIRTPVQAPNGNAHAERFVLSIKSECLGRMIWRMIFFGDRRRSRARSPTTRWCGN